MKRICSKINLFPVFLIYLISTAGFAQEELTKGILFQAMQDELNRSMKELYLEHQDRPYYIAYRVLDSRILEIKASGGGVLYSNKSHSRQLYVDLRVGSYRMDNGNFICQTSGSRVIGSDRTALPLEDEYFALRQAIWLVTDGTYKKALEQLARKKAYLQNKQSIDTTPDFMRVKPCSLLEPVSDFRLNPDDLNLKVCRLSKIFEKFPQILESSVTLKAVLNHQYFLDSEGGRSLRGNKLYQIDIRAKALAGDGEMIEDFWGFYTKEEKELDFDEIENSITAWAETLYLKARLEKEEPYCGPVLFLGQAACELFFQILGKGISDVRKPIFESEMLEANLPKENLGILAGRFQRKVAADFISAWDDPNLNNWEGKRLTGGFSIDDQGVRAEMVEILKDGRLTGFLMSRSPTDKFQKANGHARYCEETYGWRYIGFVSNLVINSNSKISSSELIKRLKELARDYGNSYAIVITRLKPTFPQSEAERYQSFYSSRGKTVPLLSTPFTLYKLYTETNELSLIRGLEFSQVTPKILRDIIATGDKEYVYNFIYYDNNGNEFPVSVVAPAILIEEMDLVPKEEKTIRPPIVKRPY
ncbi:MAG: metallopeptidase TldD-related protein [candidate division WOR-3 bacterium]